MLQAEHIPDLFATTFFDSSQVSQVAAELDDWRNQFPSQRNVMRSAVLNMRNCSPTGDGGVCDIELGTEGIYSLWLELVEDCNLDCIFCYNSWRPMESQLRTQQRLTSTEYLEVVTSIMSTIEIRHVTLSGGEPLLFSKLGELLGIIRNNGCQSVGMTTNGRSLTRSRINRLSDAGLTHISVPLHSYREHVHNELANGNSWKAAIRALALGIEKSLAVTLSCVITSKNLLDIPKVIQIARYLGIRTMVFNCMHETGQAAGRTDLSVSSNDFDEVVRNARTALSEHGDIFVGSPPAAQSYRSPTIDRIVISPYGDIKLCNQSSTGVLNLLGGPPGSLESFLIALRTNSYAKYLEKVDNCSCRGTSSP